MELASHVDSFFDLVRHGTVEVYNKFSLQHELGIYLRSALGDGRTLQFERPVDFFGIDRGLTVRKDIDICVSGPMEHEHYAIELKYPRQGQYPEQMFSACKDILFVEQLVRAGFAGGLFVIATDDRLFYSGVSGHDIYGYFRAGRPIHGSIDKPTAESNVELDILGSYVLDWKAAGAVHYGLTAIGQV